VVWRFPFFGAFPYKGFFKREDALRLADRLRKKGYDVFVRRAEAFSTLGFFKDPVFSFMTDYPEYDMASLIIHEQTHATIFVKNSTEFNEQLATFVGREGALLYLRRKYGEGSTEYRAVLEDLEDEQRFFDLMGDLYRRLDRLYRSDAGEEEKAERRKQIFDDFQSDLGRNYNSYFKTGAYRRMTELSMNNAVVLSVMRYTQDLSLFYRFYEENGCDLPLMIRRLSALLAERKRGGRKGRMLSPAEYLRRSIEEGSAMGHGN
jgi:predicted aminopeptidase